jgi:hypothetical protein
MPNTNTITVNDATKNSRHNLIIHPLLNYICWFRNLFISIATAKIMQKDSFKVWHLELPKYPSQKSALTMLQLLS